MIMEVCITKVGTFFQQKIAVMIIFIIFIIAFVSPFSLEVGKNKAIAVDFDSVKNQRLIAVNKQNFFYQLLCYLYIVA